MDLLMELYVIFIVVKKELKLYLRYPVWVLFDALMPLAWTLSTIIYSKALVGSPSSSFLASLTITGDYVSFTVIGMVISSYVFSTLWGMSYALRGEQWSGTLESVFLAPCSRFSILIGKALFSMATTTLWVLLQLVASSIIFNIKIIIANIPFALMFLIMSLPSFFGIGFSLAGIVLEFKEHNAFVNFLSTILGFILPIAYPLVVLPPFIQYIAYLLPPTYAIEGIRNSLLSNIVFSESLNIMLPLLFFDVFWMLIGILVYRKEERKVMKKGTLGYY